MSGKVELELLRRLEAMTVERDSERAELERLRRLVPIGNYTLNVAHEEEIQRLRSEIDQWLLAEKRMREAFRAAERRELKALAELDEERANIETLKLHVETLREAWRSASDEVNRLRAERDALAGEASSIEQNVGALLDLYHDRMLEAENQSKLAWERHAEKDRAYGSALAERDEAREALGTAWLAGGVSLAEGIRRKTARLEQLAIKKVAP